MKFSTPRVAPLGAFLLALATLPDAAHAADAGLIAVVQNNVTVVFPKQDKQEKTIKASAMLSLPTNTRLQVGSGSHAVIVLYKDGSRYSLPAGSTTMISADDIKTSGGTATRLPSLKIEQTKLLRSSTIAYGRAASVTVRGGKFDMDLRSLLSGSTLQDNPVFKWAPVPQAASYQLQLLDENDTSIFRQEVHDSTFTYPTDAPALKAGIDYVWNVSTIVGDDIYSGSGTFNLLPADKQQELQKELDNLQAETDPQTDDEYLSTILKAEIYHKYNLLDQAVELYQSIIAKSPDSVSLHFALSELLAGQNRNAASKIEYEKATQLLGE